MCFRDIMADTYDDHKMAARDYQTAVSQFLAAVKTWQRTPREYNQFSAITDVTDSAWYRAINFNNSNTMELLQFHISFPHPRLLQYFYVLFSSKKFNLPNVL